MIDEALLIEPSIGSVCNAFDHMWGYFKNVQMKMKNSNLNCSNRLLLVER